MTIGQPNPKSFILYQDFKKWALSHSWLNVFDGSDAGYSDWLTPSGNKIVTRIRDGRVVRAFVDNTI